MLAEVCFYDTAVNYDEPILYDGTCGSSITGGRSYESRHPPKPRPEDLLHVQINMEFCVVNGWIAATEYFVSNKPLEYRDVISENERDYFVLEGIKVQDRSKEFLEIAASYEGASHPQEEEESAGLRICCEDVVAQGPVIEIESQLVSVRELPSGLIVESSIVGVSESDIAEPMLFKGEADAKRKIQS